MDSITYFLSIITTRLNSSAIIETYTVTGLAIGSMMEFGTVIIKVPLTLNTPFLHSNDSVFILFKIHIIILSEPSAELLPFKNQSFHRKINIIYKYINLIFQNLNLTKYFFT